MALYSIWGKVGESFEKWFCWGLNYSYSWCMLDNLVSDLVLDCCFMFSASIFFNSFVKFNLVVCDICACLLYPWFYIIELFFLIVSIILSAMLIYVLVKKIFGFYIFQKTFPSAPWISVLNQGKSYILFLDLQLPKLRLSLSLSRWVSVTRSEFYMVWWLLKHRDLFSWRFQ